MDIQQVIKKISDVHISEIVNLSFKPEALKEYKVLHRPNILVCKMIPTLKSEKEYKVLLSDIVQDPTEGIAFLGVAVLCQGCAVKTAAPALSIDSNLFSKGGPQREEFVELGMALLPLMAVAVDKVVAFLGEVGYDISSTEKLVPPPHLLPDSPSQTVIH